MHEHSERHHGRSQVWGRQKKILAEEKEEGERENIDGIGNVDGIMSDLREEKTYYSVTSSNTILTYSSNLR